MRMVVIFFTMLVLIVIAFDFMRMSINAALVWRFDLYLLGLVIAAVAMHYVGWLWQHRDNPAVRELKRLDKRRKESWERFYRSLEELRRLVRQK